MGIHPTVERNGMGRGKNLNKCSVVLSFSLVSFWQNTLAQLEAFKTAWQTSLMAQWLRLHLPMQDGMAEERRWSQGGHRAVLLNGLPWLPFSSDGKEPACNAGDPGSIPGLGRSSGEEHGNPLQYPCLENPMDRGAWRATVRGLGRVRHDWETNTTAAQCFSHASPEPSNHHCQCPCGPPWPGTCRLTLWASAHPLLA